MSLEAGVVTPAGAAAANTGAAAATTGAAAATTGVEAGPAGAAVATTGAAAAATGAECNHRCHRMVQVRLELAPHVRCALDGICTCLIGFECCLSVVLRTGDLDPHKKTNLR